MTDVTRLEAAFDAGTLMRAGHDTPNIVDLSRAIAAVAGVRGLDLTPAARSISETIGDPAHLVLVLADGVGSSLITAQPQAHFLREHLMRDLLTVFPSTTSAALTTIATGLWPAQHAITGWWTYLPAIAEDATILPFVRRSDDRPLTEADIEEGTAFPSPSLVPRMRREVLFVLPRRIVNSVYSRYSSGGAASAGYRSLSEAIDLVVEHARAASGATYSYLYTPIVDGAAHEFGTGSHEVRAALLAVDGQLARLASALGDDARIVTTADHGHLDGPPAARLTLPREGGFDEWLAAPPSGDPRVLHFRLRAGARDAFAKAFRERLGEHFVLLTLDEVDGLRLFGPDPLSEETRLRLGDFVAISLGQQMIAYEGAREFDHLMAQQSNHSGLTPAEMTVPLIIV